MAKEKNVFVIMPFSATASCTENEWLEIYDQVFRPAVEACGYGCARSRPSTGSLIASIVDQIRSARIVIADVTDQNANVFYELGVRHSLSKRTIIVCQSADQIPSDLRGYWWLEYGIRPAQVSAFKNELERMIAEIDTNPEKSDSPVSDYLERENLSISEFVRTDNVKKIGALCTELSGNIIALTNLSAGVDMPSRAFITTDCLRLLLQTMYVDIGPSLLRQAYELFRDLRYVESGEIDERILLSALLMANSLSQELLTIRSQLATHEYEEPPVISTMVWQSSSASVASCATGALWQYARCFLDNAMSSCAELKLHRPNAFLSDKEDGAKSMGQVISASPKRKPSAPENP